MDNKTLIALKESISDWKKRAKNGNLGSKECPLCTLEIKKEGLGSKCTDCIIKKRTGRAYCHGTPYWAWVDAVGKLPLRQQLICANEEVEFLESFLPKEEKMKFVIGNEKKEAEVELYLRKGAEGIVTLMTGNGICLMDFKDGKFERCCGAGMDGIKTSREGKILEVGEYDGKGM